MFVHEIRDTKATTKQEKQIKIKKKKIVQQLQIVIFIDIVITGSESGKLFAIKTKRKSECTAIRNLKH